MNTKHVMAGALVAALGIGSLPYLVSSAPSKSTQKRVTTPSLEARVAVTPKHKKFTDVEEALAQKNYRAARRYAGNEVKQGNIGEMSALFNNLPYEERPLLLSQRDAALVERVNNHYKAFNIDVDAFTGYDILAFVIDTGKHVTATADVDARNDLYTLVEKAQLPKKLVRECTEAYDKSLVREFDVLNDKMVKCQRLPPEDESRYTFLKNEMKNLNKARLRR